MKPFHFSLHAVRTLRLRQEQFALEAFGRAVQSRQEALEKQHACERELQTAWHSLEQLQLGGATAVEINQMREHCQVQQQRLKRCMDLSVVAQETAGQAWEALNDARQQLEVVDKFYLRRREEYERELRGEEQKQLDEMAGRRWMNDPVMAPPATASWN